MFIQTEATPNPNTMKFLPGREVMGMGSADFPTPESAERSPLVQRLFGVEGISSVYLGGDFVTVTKSEDDALDWNHLKPAILGAIMDHYTSGQPVMNEGNAADDGAADLSSYEGDEIEIVEQIVDLIETRVRPAVANDGGDIVFHDYKEGVVRLTMRGACAGCPASTQTLKQGIENLLRHYIPEVQEVIAVD